METQALPLDRIQHLRSATDPGIRLIIDEIDRNRAALQRTWRFGLGLSFILAIYFAWLVVRVRTVVFHPATLGAAAATAVDRAFPEALKKIEMSLSENPERFAKQATAALDRLMHISRVNAEKHIAQLPAVIAMVREPFIEDLRRLAREHGDEVRELYASGKTDQEVADHIVELALQGAVTGLDALLKKQTNGAAGLTEMSSVAFDMLQKADRHLRYLANVPPWRMTKRDQLERRTLAAWTHVVEKRINELD